MATKSYRDEETLRQLYYGEGLTQPEIADRLDTSESTVSRYMRKHDITGEEPWKDRDTLHQLYWDDGYSTREIGEHFDISHHTVQYWMDKLDVKMRVAPRDRVPCFQMDGQGYERWSHYDGERHCTYDVRRLLAIAEYGIDAVKDMHVHHCNWLSWGNWGSNVIPLTASEHSKIHNSN